MNVRLATFNVENLFSRARVLNLDNQAEGTKMLDLIRQLQDELAKEVYDQGLIWTLYQQTKAYIDVVEVREKLFKWKLNAAVAVAAKGRKSWEGWIEFKRDPFDDNAQKNTAQVVKDLDADIVCLVEVENRDVLQKFGKPIFKGNKQYAYNMLIRGNDDRGINVGLLSRYPIQWMRSHISDKSNGHEIFARDCLELKVEIAQGRFINILLNHFTSQRGGAAAAKRRQLQSGQVKAILTANYNLPQDAVVVMGDFNDTPDSPNLKSLLTMPELTDVLSAKFGNDLSLRWTYYYKKQQQIDYILTSSAITFRDAGIIRKGIFDLAKITNGAEKQYPTVTSPETSASDHGAVWADVSW